MTDADRDRMTTLIALVVIGVPFDTAIAMTPVEADVVLTAWRDSNSKAAN